MSQQDININMFLEGAIDDPQVSKEYYYHSEAYKTLYNKYNKIHEETGQRKFEHCDEEQYLYDQLFEDEFQELEYQFGILDASYSSLSYYIENILKKREMIAKLNYKIKLLQKSLNE